MIPGGMSDLAIPSDGPYLTHEPLCIELYGKPDYRIASCAVCNLIARVRDEMQPACVCKFGRGYRAAIRDVDALEALVCLTDVPMVDVKEGDDA
jgi:hypothetical protein